MKEEKEMKENEEVVEEAWERGWRKRTKVEPNASQERTDELSVPGRSVRGTSTTLKDSNLVS